MLRDDRAGGEGRPQAAHNVLGEALEICSIKPMTGFYRDGCCDTGREDLGSHTICAVMTSAFLEGTEMTQVFSTTSAIFRGLCLLIAD